MIRGVKSPGKNSRQAMIPTNPARIVERTIHWVRTDRMTPGYRDGGTCDQTGLRCVRSIWALRVAGPRMWGTG